MSAKPRAAFLIVTLLCLYILGAAVADRDLVMFAYSKTPGRELPAAEKQNIVATIRSYNLILSDFYASGGVHSLLDQFPANKAVKHGIFRDLGYIKSADRILVYDHASLNPKKITLTAPGKAEALFFEEWNYMYQSIADRKPLSLPRGFGQWYRYALVREQGKWIVDGWDPVSLPDPGKQKKEFLF